VPYPLECCGSETEEETQWLAEELAQIEAATRRASAVPAALAAGHGGDASERAAAPADLARIGNSGALSLITCLDDVSPNVRNVAARALFELEPQGTPESFSQALEEGSTERRRKLGAAMAASGFATKATSNLTGESREDPYNALCLLYVMEVETAGRKADEAAQRLAEEQAQTEAAEAARRAEAEERRLEQGSLPVSESVGNNSRPRSLARRFLLRFARKI
jgi:hypothetical protein